MLNATIENQTQKRLTAITLNCSAAQAPSTKGNMNIAQVLSELAAVKPSNNNPIIKKSSTKGQNYEFTQPYYLMSLRAMLKKTPTETVEKLEL